jgi:hypothetical protein
MLTVQVHDFVIFVHYLPEPRQGYFARVFPGGTFLGKTYEEYVALGTGDHEVPSDLKADSDEDRGTPSPYMDVWQEASEGQLWAQFLYSQQDRWKSTNIKDRVHINSFVRRQTKESPFSYWTFDDEELYNRILAGWFKFVPGYRDGVILVPIDPKGCFSGIIQLKAGDKLVGEYTARKEGEEPRKHTYAVGEKLPAKTCYVVLYRHDVLVEGKENETDKEWEMVSFNASPTDKEPPIVPGTLIANHFKLSGGTATGMTDSEFVAALKVSVEYWKDKAMATPK